MSTPLVSRAMCSAPAARAWGMGPGRASLRILRARLSALTCLGGLPTAGRLHSRQWQRRQQQQQQQRQRVTAFPEGIEHLVADSTLPILKMCCISAVGAYCARQGLIDQEGRRKLSKLALNVFTPALMLSKLGPHIDLHQALALWPIGVNVVICHLTGLALGFAHTMLMPPPPHLSHLIKATTAISNVGNLPLVMVMSLVHSPHLHFNTAAEADLAVSYVMLGWFYATMIQMPIGHWLLHKGSTLSSAGKRSQTEPAADDHMPAGQPKHTLLQQQLARQHPLVEQHTLLSTPLAGSMHRLPVVAAAFLAHTNLPELVPAATPAASQKVRAFQTRTSLSEPQVHIMAADAYLEEALGQNVLHLNLIQQLPGQLQPGSRSSSLSSAVPAAAFNAIQPSISSGASYTSSSSLCSSRQPSRHVQPLPAAMLQHLHQSQLQLVQGLQSSHLLEGLMSAPLLAGLAAIGIGSCPSLKEALFTAEGSLSVIGDSVHMLGQPLIPILLLVLGANLSHGPGSAELPLTSILGVIVCRLLLLPMLGCFLVQAAQECGIIQMQDPLALVVMMVVWSTPTAILVHSLASVHRNGEDEVSALLFWEYAACVFTLPLCSSAYLYLLGCCVAYDV